MSSNPSHRSRQILACLQNVRFSHDDGASWVLDGIDLTIHQGEHIGIIGPNGAGKSTLARIIAGLSAPDDGTVTLLGHEVFVNGTPSPHQYREARRDIGIVFQNPADQIITTVTQDDTAFGPENLGMSPASITVTVDEALKSVDMRPSAQSDPTRLSGGQQQRVAIAGTLAMRPRLIVLDEPTAMLDAPSRSNVMKVLNRLQSSGITIVHVTHHTQELRRCDRLLSLEHGHLREITRTDLDTRDMDALTFIRHDHIEKTNHPATATREAFTDAMPHDGLLHHERTHEGCHPIDDAAMVRVSHVSRRYADNDRDTIHDFSMSVSRGETVAIMGSNGSGKTTLTRLLAALDKPDEGNICIDGIDLIDLDKHNRRLLRRTVGLVMQQPENQLFAPTVLEDVSYGPRNLGYGSEEAERLAHRALKLFGIDRLAERSPFSLSGGQQRLAAIAGVVASNPPVLIMDEPAAGLDHKAALRINELITILADRGTTVILVTHSLEQARTLGCRIIRMPDTADRTATTDTDAAASDDETARHSPDSVCNQTGARNAITKRNGRKTHGLRHGGIAVGFGATWNGRRSFVRSLDPRIKLVMFIALLFTGFTVATPWQLVAAALMTLALTAASRINPLRLLSSLKLWLGMFAALGLINMFFIHSGRVLFAFGSLQITEGGIYDAVLYSCRLALVVILGDILLITTTPTQLTDAFGALLSPLSRFGLHAQEIALVMSLALRFLPTLADETHAIIDAQAARGGSIETGTPTARLRALGAVIVPVFTGALRHSDNLALALDARCFEAGIRRTHWHEMKATGRDWRFVGACTVYMILLALLSNGFKLIWA